MFFLWLIKNKHFQKGGDFRGQITPLLIVVIVVMVMAALVTVNIGRIALDKTYSSNASDACSLSAASHWASAFNYLAKYNERILESWYDMNFIAYETVLYPLAEQYLDMSIALSALAAVYVQLAGDFAAKDPPVRCKPYPAGLQGFIHYGIATGLLFYAYEQTMFFNYIAIRMKSLTDTFHEAQWRYYCDARDYMHDVYIASEKAGLSYAFTNSGIPAKLSKEQSNEFSKWLTDEASWLSEEGPHNVGNYGWSDKLQGEHSVSVNLDLPDVISYELQHTKGSYSKITNLLDKMIDVSEIVMQVQLTTASVTGTQAGVWLTAYMMSLTMVALCGCLPECAGAVEAVFTALSWLHAELIKVDKDIQRIMRYLIIGSAGGSALTLWFLKDKNEEAMEKWRVDGVQSSSSCDDAEDLMIVKIFELTLRKWTTICCVEQEHPDSSAGIVPTSYPRNPGVTSCSTSRFDGGSVGDFNLFGDYDSAIVTTKESL
ncbi:MAG: pilus assembly protein TadG-related protein [Candidatus Omnitrophota bacterium]|jgi:hypothetical protein